MRVGIGYDVHAFDEHRPLILGGVLVEGAPGLAGWSDADLLSHAVADALLGAAHLGDIGDHFSQESVPEGLESLEMLVNTAALVRSAGFEIANIDTVLMIQDVRVSPHKAQMEARMAESLSVDPSLVSVKATTTDRLGFVGKSEGAAAMAVALIE